MVVYTKEELDQVDVTQWLKYRKIKTTRARRIANPFAVQTREGILTCDNGYLCIDSQGYPYPVAKDEFEMIYEFEQP